MAPPGPGRGRVGPSPAPGALTPARSTGLTGPAATARRRPPGKVPASGPDRPRRAGRPYRRHTQPGATHGVDVPVRAATARWRPRAGPRSPACIVRGAPGGHTAGRRHGSDGRPARSRAPPIGQLPAARRVGRVTGRGPVRAAAPMGFDARQREPGRGIVLPRGPARCPLPVAAPSGGSLSGATGQAWPVPARGCRGQAKALPWPPAPWPPGRV